MTQRILSVVSAGARKGRQFSFQLQHEDRTISTNFKRLTVIIDSQSLEVVNGLRAYRNWGRITHPEIHLWITQNRLHRTPPRKPAKLIFLFSKRGNRHILELYQYQANLINK
jgi:hypothetical protein